MKQIHKISYGIACIIFLSYPILVQKHQKWRKLQSIPRLAIDYACGGRIGFVLVTPHIGRIALATCLVTCTLVTRVLQLLCSWLPLIIYFTIRRIGMWAFLIFVVHDAMAYIWIDIVRLSGLIMVNIYIHIPPPPPPPPPTRLSQPMYLYMTCITKQRVLIHNMFLLYFQGGPFWYPVNIESINRGAHFDHYGASGYGGPWISYICEYIGVICYFEWNYVPLCHNFSTNDYA